MISNDTCSTTSDGNSMFGRIQTNSTYQNYTITVLDDIWQFSATPFYSCPNNFMLLFRPLGLWCMGVLFKTTSSGISQQDAVQKCSTDYNGILSGFQTTEEKVWLVGVTKGKESGYNYDGYWVNGKRKITCMYRNQTGTACNGSNAFTFTDPTMSWTNAYTWGYDSQPDGMTDNLGTSNCIVFRVRNNDGGGMDDRPCDSVANPNVVFYNGFVCGLKPNES
uniref:C-type lectin domain-containing protein n=2 Tax=Caenorhabditis tropicalis TaxID=1561998 RepID=A0A1I7T710_9PELO